LTPMLAGGLLGLVGPSEQGDPPPPETMRRYVIGFLFRVSNAPAIREAEALGARDPAVRAGRLRFEYHPWYGAKGITIVPPEGRKK